MQTTLIFTLIAHLLDPYLVAAVKPACDYLDIINLSSGYLYTCTVSSEVWLQNTGCNEFVVTHKMFYLPQQCHERVFNLLLTHFIFQGPFWNLLSRQNFRLYMIRITKDVSTNRKIHNSAMRIQYTSQRSWRRTNYRLNMLHYLLSWAITTKR